MSEKITSALIQSPTGGLFSTMSVDGSGIVIKNASDDTRSDGTFVPAGSDTLVLSAVGESSFLNASYMKVGVLDASLMRTGLLQTVASWNSKWYGSSADSMDVQQGFSGGKFTPVSVSTTSDTITLSDLKSPSGTNHNITTSDYVRVSGLVFDVSGDDVYGNVGVDSPGSGVMDYADVTAVTTTTVTFGYDGIGAGKSTLNKYSIPFISKVVEISSISRVYDDGATDDNPGELSTVTVNTSSAHGLSTGNYVELHGVEDSLNGVWRVSSAPSSTQFTFMQRFVEDLDWENDGSVTLPEYGSPVAIEVAKSYRVTSDGTLLAYGAVFNPAGQRRSAILLQGDSTQGDIAVPADGTLHIGYRNGTDGLGGSFETIMKINTPATGNQANTTIYGTVTVDVLNATTINGGTAGSAVIPNDLVTQTIQTTSGNVRIRPYENDGTSANKRGEIEWYTQVSSTGAFTSQVMTFSDKDYPGALVVDPDLKVLGDADVVGTLSAGNFQPTIIDAEQIGTDYFQVRNGNILIDPSVSDGPGGQTRGEITFRTWNGAAYTTRGKIYASAGVGTKLAVDSPFRIVDATASTSDSTGALIVDGGAGIGGKLYIGDVTESTAYTNGALVVPGGVGIAKALRVQGKAWFQDVDVANALDIGELNVDSFNIEYNGTRRATIIGSSTSAGQVSMYFNEGVNDLTFYVSGAITTTNGGPITSGGQLTASASTETTSAAPGSQTGALVAVGGASIGKSLRVNDNLFVTGESNLLGGGSVFADYIQIGTAISPAAGNAVISQAGWITVNQDTVASSTATGAVVIAGGLGVGKTVWANGFRTSGTATSINATGGTSYFGWLYGGTADPTDAINFPGSDVVISPSGLLTINSTFDATGTSAGALLVRGGVAVAKDVWAANFRTAGTVQAGTVSAGTITGTFTGSLNPSSLTVSGGASFATAQANGSVVITSSGLIAVNSSATSTSGNTGALVVGGGIGVGGEINVSSTNAATATASQASIKTLGGVAVAKDVWAANFRTAGTVQAGTITGTFTGSLAPSSLTVSGGASFATASSTAVITSSGLVTINATATSTSGNTGALVVAGGVGVGGEINISSTAAATSVASQASIKTAGGIAAAKDIWAANFRTAGTVQAGTITGTFAGSLNPSSILVSGNAAFATAQANGSVVITSSGLVTINATATSTSGNTGALVVAGGLGVQGAANFVGNVSLANNTGDNVTAVLPLGTTGSTYRTVYITTDTAITGTNNQFLRYGASSKRFKTNIQKIEGDFGIYDLPVNTFNWVHDYDPNNPELNDQKKELGFIAEDVYASPWMGKYVYFEEGQIAGINYERLTIPLVGAVQDLNKRIKSLEARVAELESSA